MAWPGTSPAIDPLRNRVLAALPEPVWQRLRSDLEPVELPLGEVLLQPGDPLAALHFPLTTLVSLMQVLSDGRSAELAVIGPEGAVGAAALLANERSSMRAIVQQRGWALRLPARSMRREVERSAETACLLARCVMGLLAQLAQSAVCNRHHQVEQQLSRWLLLSFDRLPGDELTMTQELIAQMMGVRREGVSLAASRLQSEGLIRYSRGAIRLLNRDGLERRACECYRTVRQEVERLLPSPRAEADPRQMR